MLTKDVKTGFTLAEVLIALALLGIVAAFTIPKVLQSQDNEHKKLVFKETIAALSSILHEGRLKNELTPTNIFTYFSQKLNALRTCTDAQLQGCWPGASDFAANTPTAPGMVIPNGAYITDFEPQSTGFDNIYLDWNGTSAPNQVGSDQICLTLIWNIPGSTDNGKIIPLASCPAANRTLWDSLFQ